MFVRSTNGGQTFSTPKRVNDDPVNHNKWHWMGTLSVAPNGRIDSVWLDTRNAANNTDSQLFYSYSTDGGVTWAPNVAVSNSFNPFLGYPQQNKMGDYITIVSDNTGADVAYTATFNLEEDIYYVRVAPAGIPTPTPTPTATPLANTDGNSDSDGHCDRDGNSNRYGNHCTDPNAHSNANPDAYLVAMVSLPVATVDTSVTNFTQPVVTSAINAGDNLIGFQGDFTFDETVVTFQSPPVSNAGLTGGNWNVSGNVLPGPGPIRTLRVSAFSNDFTPLSGSGTLYNLNMTRVSSTPGANTALTWAAPPDNFIFIDADLNTSAPGNTPPGSITHPGGHG